MKKFCVVVLIFLISLSYSANAKLVPGLTIMPPEKAIAIARDYIKTHNIENKYYYISKIEYINFDNEYEPTGWRITYVELSRVKGGEYWIFITPDGQVKINYGE